MGFRLKFGKGIADNKKGDRILIHGGAS